MMIQAYEAWRYEALSIDQKNKFACLRELQAYRALINDVVPLLVDGCDFAQSCVDGNESQQVKNKAEAWKYTVEVVLKRIGILHPVEPVLPLPK